MIRSLIHPCRSCRRGFTLLEALIATSILFGVVMAVTTALVAGQQHALEANERVAGTLAAEALMGQIVTGGYDNLLTWNGYSEAAGQMLDEYGAPMPASFGSIGRAVSVITVTETVDPPNVNIRGRIVTVVAFDETDRVLITLERFVAEPPV